MTIWIVNDILSFVTGKTTFHLARAAVQAGRRVLVVDLDPQGNLTSAIAAETVDEDRAGLADALRAIETLRDVIVPGLCRTSTSCRRRESRSARSAPFCASSDEEVGEAARTKVGGAVLVRNMLSRFAHRDAAKHAGEINTAELPKLVDDAAYALYKAGQADKA